MSGFWWYSGAGEAQLQSFAGVIETLTNEATNVPSLDEPVTAKPAKITIVKAHEPAERFIVTQLVGGITPVQAAVTYDLVNVATSSQTVLSAEAQDLNQSGQGSFTTADATAETINSSATSTQTFDEAIGDTVSNSATSTQSTLEALAETDTNSATSTQTILSAEAQDANNAGTGSFTVADATAETTTNSATSVQTIDEVIAITETITSDATSVPAILTAEAQELNNSGAGSFTTADATAESPTLIATASISIEELIFVSILETIDAPGYDVIYEFVAA